MLEPRRLAARAARVDHARRLDTLAVGQHYRRGAACQHLALGHDRARRQRLAHNRIEALREVRLDLDEGADIVMVKPAMSYLDIVRDVAEISDVPVAAYQISGEYSMITAAAERGWIDRDAAILESLTSIKRAGASIILTYWAAEVAAALA